MNTSLPTIQSFYFNTTEIEENIRKHGNIITNETDSQKSSQSAGKKRNSLLSRMKQMGSTLGVAYNVNAIKPLIERKDFDM